VVDSKYDISWDGWCSFELAGAFGVGMWKKSEKVGILSQAILDLLWGTKPGSAFGMICGAGTWLLW
jgi:hypothetical protein